MALKRFCAKNKEQHCEAVYLVIAIQNCLPCWEIRDHLQIWFRMLPGFTEIY